MITIDQQSDNSLSIPDSIDYTAEKLVFRINFIGQKLDNVTHIKITLDGKEYMFHRPLYYRPTDTPWSAKLETGYIRQSQNAINCKITVYNTNNIKIKAEKTIIIEHHSEEIENIVLNKLIYSANVTGIIMTINGNTELYVVDE